LPPAVTNLPAAQIRAAQALLGADVTSTGGETPQVTIFLGPVDGGTVTNDWQRVAVIGAFSGAGTATVTNLTPGTTFFYRARAANSGGAAWAAESARFTTDVLSAAVIETRDADGITGTTATLRGEVTDDGNDPPVCTLFYGTADAGTNAVTWQVGVPLGVHDGDLSRFVTGLSPQTVYFFRLRAVNAAGTAWSTPAAAFTTTPLVPQTAVINEFHYKPLDDTSLEEFIELRNPGDTALDLSGWSLTSGVAFTFPASTILAAGGYLVVAENPAVILGKYGKTALGPWTGNLSSKGETIELRDAAGVLRDRVAYGAGFPWPTAPDGAGNSAELLNPSLDNDLGGSWRASGAVGTPAQTFVTPSSTGWRYKKGTAEASSPVDAWRAIAYDDSSWLTGQTPIGYGTTIACNTVLSDMLAAGGASLNYRTVYGRRAFTVPVAAIPDTLTLKVRIDDGCVVWINGTEVYRVNVGTGQRPYNDSASTSIGTAAWTTVTLTGTSAYLFGGSNVLAIHAINRNSTSGRPDFSFDAELGSPAAGGNSSPTPGAVNNSNLPDALVPPQVRQVDHSPKSPASAQPVTVTARITDPDGMGAVSLSYQTVDPGSYIRLTDAAYSTAWTSVPMVDSGAAGDAVAGDSIFTAVLPANLQVNRRLVRYRITFADALGNSATVPYADDEQPNFAYYVYDGLPAWQGAFRPGTTTVDTFPSTLLDDLPVYSLVANGTDVINSQYSSGFDAVRFRGTFVCNGEVYDHIQFKNRGEASTYVSGKNKWRFFFNRARDLPAKDNFNKSYSETWGSFSGDACASPWAALHRGMAGVEEAVSYKIFQLAGLPSPNTHYYHFRVVRGVTETPAAGTTITDPIGTADGQYCGDFWGLYLAVEQPDGSFLDERGLPDGNVYKIEGNAGDKKHQAPGQSVDSSDWNTFRDGHINTTAARPGGARTWTWRPTTPSTPSTASPATWTSRRLRPLLLHRSSDNRWVPMPWDLDMMFIAKHHWTTSIGGTSIPASSTPTATPPAAARPRPEYRNRAREILDLLASDATPAAARPASSSTSSRRSTNPAGVPLTWADADGHVEPASAHTGSDGTHSGQTNHKGNFYWTTFADDRIGGELDPLAAQLLYSGVAAHEDCMAYLRDYATDAWPGGTWTTSNGNQLGYGYQYLAYEATDAAIPDRPVLTHTGPPGYPANALTFSSSAFGDPQGAGTYAAQQWRVAEISGPGISGYVAGTRRKYEIETAWSSGELTSAPGSFTVPLQVVQVGKTYRVRVRHKDATGRWSRWSLPAQFQAAQPPLVLLHYWNFNTPPPSFSPTQTIGGGTSPRADGRRRGGIRHRPELRRPQRPQQRPRRRAPAPQQPHSRPARSRPAHHRLHQHRRALRNPALRPGCGHAGGQYTLNGATYTEFARIAPVDGTPTLQTLDFRSYPPSTTTALRPAHPF
ncbi:MAG: lamin tail domain-containing protein, partial [Kiritimatiellia bacterium]